jgi:hypothetical protein
MPLVDVLSVTKAPVEVHDRRVHDGFVVMAQQVRQLFTWWRAVLQLTEDGRS